MTLLHLHLHAVGRSEGSVRLQVLCENHPGLTVLQKWDYTCAPNRYVIIRNLYLGIRAMAVKIVVKLYYNPCSQCLV